MSAPAYVYGTAYQYTKTILMRTNVEIDDSLLEEAMTATGLKTKKATIEEALKRLVKNHQLQRAIEDMRGLGWEGDLDEMRRGWSAD